MSKDAIVKQIKFGSEKAQKTYGFDEAHDKTRPAQMWFQESNEGLILFVVFFSQACRWSRCLGCNLPMLTTTEHISYKYLMAQIDHVIKDPEVVKQKNEINKVIISNNGSILDEGTFSSTALMYLIAQLNLHLPNLAILSMETRPEYVDVEELEFISRALAEGDTSTLLEITIGFEAFDNHVRNTVFDKGLSLEAFEGLVQKMAPYKFHLKCYFMQKPVPGISGEEAIKDIHKAIDYLSEVSEKYGIEVNIHLNPTYVAKGTELETAYHKGEYSPPDLPEVARAAVYAADKRVSIFIGLSDEGLAVEGGSFIRNGDEPIVEQLELFNRTQDYRIIEKITMIA